MVTPPKRKVRVSSGEILRAQLDYELDVPMKSILIQPDELQGRVSELGQRISDDYRGRMPLLISILKGGVVFLTDLMRAVSIPHHIDFLQVSSYAGGTSSTGTVRIMSDLGTNIAGRDVLLVEDIIDTGLTVSYLIKQLQIRQPASLRVCSLLSKPEARTVNVPIEYLGFEIPNVFVVGYGLDYEEKYRNLPYIGVLDL
jgi:hypoxanthine phosphoribosyltransferase